MATSYQTEISLPYSYPVALDVCARSLVQAGFQVNTVDPQRGVIFAVGR